MSVQGDQEDRHMRDFGFPSNGPLDIKDDLVDAMDAITARAEDRRATPGLSTGLSDLDEITGGLRRGHLVVLGSRPSMGRTSLALGICLHVALVLKRAVLFATAQQPRREVIDRLISTVSGVCHHKVLTGKGVGQNEMVAMGKAFQQLVPSPLLVDACTSMTADRIAEAAGREKLAGNLGLIVVDEIQLLEEDGPPEDRHERTASSSRRLKQLALELNVPILAISQLNREMEREGRLPRMTDLRGSGSIEQDADVILLLHRPEYYDPNHEPGIAWIIINKNRSGLTGSLRLTFLRNIMRFENLAENVGLVEGVF
jgi:replicative DNA helicase